jgi:hypothetical protein
VKTFFGNSTHALATRHRQLKARSELYSVEHTESTNHTGQTMVSQRKMLKPKNTEVDEWNVVKSKVKGKKKKIQAIL